MDLPATNKAATDALTWLIDDVADRLRVVGTDRAYRLPDASVATWTLGASRDCDVQIDDPTGCVSRRHLQLVREGASWMARDLASTNGVMLDGERRLAFQLTPGAHIGIGGVTLVAESPRLRELAQLMERLLGWSMERRSDVDAALLAIREMATGRAALALCGPGDLRGVVSRLHAVALGSERPMAWAYAKSTDLNAQTGTLCVVASAVSRDYLSLASQMSTATHRLARRLVFCCKDSQEAMLVRAQLGRSTTVEIPPLTTRVAEMPRLISDYATDAAHRLGAASTGFRQYELNWLRDLNMATLGEVEETTLRVVALRNWGVSGGAARLGISHVALSRWASRRHLPT